MSFRCFLCVAILLSVQLPFAAKTAFAWGERGHDLIARVASRIIVQRTKDGKLLTPFAAKEHMLGHLANVPDIYFRDLEEARKLEPPTHYIDLEYLSLSPTIANLPSDYSKAAALAEKNGYDLETKVGTNPWRCGQLQRLMTDALREANGETGKAPPTGEAFKQSVLRALTYGGLMAHYVGDLAQPLHATKDYDGWETKQGGLHSYFEEGIVSALSLSADYEVFATALKEEPFKRLLLALPESERLRVKKNPVALAFTLAIDSFKTIPQVLRLDRVVSLVSPSKSSPIKIPAERKPPAAVAEKFRALVIDRLALGADAVATLWLLAWEEAGKPDLSSFKSFDYALTPTYVAPDYILPKIPTIPAP